MRATACSAVLPTLHIVASNNIRQALQSNCTSTAANRPTFSIQFQQQQFTSRRRHSNCCHHIGNSPLNYCIYALPPLHTPIIAAFVFSRHCQLCRQIAHSIASAAFGPPLRRIANAKRICTSIDDDIAISIQHCICNILQHYRITSLHNSIVIPVSHSPLPSHCIYRPYIALRRHTRRAAAIGLRHSDARRRFAPHRRRTRAPPTPHLPHCQPLATPPSLPPRRQRRAIHRHRSYAAAANIVRILT